MGSVRKSRNALASLAKKCEGGSVRGKRNLFSSPFIPRYGGIENFIASGTDPISIYASFFFFKIPCQQKVAFEPTSRLSLNGY